MKWLLATGFLVGLLLPISHAQPCEFHPVPSFDKGLVKVEPFGTSGLVGFYYDVDGDDVPDRALLFQREANGGFVRWPVLYLEGLDLNGGAQEVWVDRVGDGLCKDLFLYFARTISGG